MTTTTTDEPLLIRATNVLVEQLPVIVIGVITFTYFLYPILVWPMIITLGASALWYVRPNIESAWSKARTHRSSSSSTSSTPTLQPKASPDDTAEEDVDGQGTMTSSVRGLATTRHAEDLFAQWQADIQPQLSMVAKPWNVMVERYIPHTERGIPTVYLVLSALSIRLPDAGLKGVVGYARKKFPEDWSYARLVKGRFPVADETTGEIVSQDTYAIAVSLTAPPPVRKWRYVINVVASILTVMLMGLFFIWLVSPPPSVENTQSA